VDLGAQPPCEAIVPESHFYAPEPFYPLHAKVCSNCLLVQLDADVAPESIYTEYAYFSSYSDSWLQHCREFSERMIQEYGLGKDSCVVELASNDGYLLRNFVDRKIPCYGVDPAANIAVVAEAKGVRTHVCFFGKESAERLAIEIGTADLIIANNVFGHVPDINDFVVGMKRLLKPSGTITIEIPRDSRWLDSNVRVSRRGQPIY